MAAVSGIRRLLLPPAAHARAGQREAHLAEQLAQARNALLELLARRRVARGELHEGLLVAHRDLDVQRSEVGRMQLDARLADVAVDEPADTPRELLVPRIVAHVER